MATARFPYHHVLKYRMSLVTPLATVEAVAVAADLDTAFSWISHCMVQGKSSQIGN